MSLARAHDPFVGRSLGEFVLRERIGQGGFGVIYRATQPALEREAVVKVLHTKLHQSKAATERFLREARLASKLDHPYAAHIYAFGAEQDGELWIAMEMVRGTPLDKILAVQGPLSLERLVPLLDRICEVVHTAHEQGIVHRDLKPANVMVLARAGRLLPKLLDFGIAKGLVAAGEDDEPLETGDTVRATPDELSPTADTLDGASEAPTRLTPPPGRITHQGPVLTQRGAIMGSPPYMAPEQWVDAGRADGRTDLYALGVLAYECLTGRPPFVGKTLAEIATAHARQSAPPLGRGFPAALDAVFAKVLAKRAEDRYPDALAFAAAFRGAAGVASEAVRVPSLEPAARDAALGTAPQPIAEAVAALEAARNLHQARDATVQLAHTITRYLGLVALACRSRFAGGEEPAAVGDMLRTLVRRTLSDAEWLDLARQLTSVWLDRRDAYPVPELVDALQDREVLEALSELATLRAPSEDQLAALLEQAIAQASRLLDRLAFLGHYPLVVTAAGGLAERWVGVRRAQRTTTPVHARDVPAGVAMLLDSEGAPVVALAPLVQVASPTPGAPLDLFLFEGRDARGGKLVALPGGFEFHDDTVWSWFRAQLATSLDDAEEAVALEKPPYRGLSAFSPDDHDRFFGREKLVDAFLNRLQIQPLLAVIGRSGAGKSSFVHAGVIPAMPRGWRAITMRPGASPLAALAARLEHAGLGPFARTALARDHELVGEHLRADAARHGPVLLVIDQLEEMFTLCQDRDERQAFAEALAAAARAPEDPVRVVFTLRDDFLVRAEQLPALRNRISHGLQLVTVPAADDLRRILTEPARRAGYEIEGDLADAMVKEVADQPGALALISFTAARLWELRDRHFKQLTAAAYRSLGGVGGALAHHADLTLDEMPPDERALAREAFRHLVTTQHTRAVLARKDLREILGGDARADSVIEKLVAARLLVASEHESGADTIEIVHEALLTAWPRLVEWRREDAEGARFREQLRSAAEQWHERGRDKGLLWRGDALADFTRWRAHNTGALTELEAAFTAASLADSARGRRNRRLLVASAFVALVAVVVALVVFNRDIAGQRARAEMAAGKLHDNLESQFEEQGRRLLLDGEPQQALAYFAKATEYGAHGPAHDFLVAEAVRATDGEVEEVAHDAPINSARFSHDGTKLVTASDDATSKLWDARTGELVRTFAHHGRVIVARFSPDDATVLTAAADGDAVVWDARTGRRLQVLHFDADVVCADYSTDGALVIAGASDGTIAVLEVATGATRFRIRDAPGGLEQCAFVPGGAELAASDFRGGTRIRDARSGNVRLELHAPPGDVNDLEFSRDGSRIVVALQGPTRAIEWELATGKQVAVLSHQGGVRSAELAPDGSSIATASGDRTAAVWDAATGARELTLSGHASIVTAARFSPDGKYLVTASDDATARLWDARDGRLVATWRGHRDAIRSLAFAPSGRSVVTASADGTAIVWNVSPQENVTWLARRGRIVTDAQFSPDGRSVVTASDTAIVWDAATGQPRLVLRGHRGSVVAAVFSPGGDAIATAGEDGTVRVWDAATGTAREVLTGSGPISGGVAWSRDGSVIAVGSDDGFVRAWEVSSGRPRFARRVDGGGAIYSIAFFPAGDRIVTTGIDSTIRVWDLGGNVVATRRDPDIPVSVDVDPSGQHVLSAATRQSAKVWNPSTGAREVELLGHVGQLWDARWSPDGTFAITSSQDRTARIWEAASGAMLEIITHPAPVAAARFAPDGRRVVVVDALGGVAIHELPRAIASPAELAAVLRCRVPFEVEGNHLRARPRERCSAR